MRHGVLYGSPWGTALPAACERVSAGASVGWSVSGTAVRGRAGVRQDGAGHRVGEGGVRSMCVGVLVSSVLTTRGLSL